MQRRIVALVLFVGVILAGHLGVTRASKQEQDQVPSRKSREELQGRDLANLESARAEQERSDLGLAIAPVPVNAGFGKTRFLIGLGSYLVNTMCISCHTNPTYAAGGNPFMGQPEKVNAANYLAGGTAFGPFVSRNLTPDPKQNNLPAGLTLEQFERTLRTGEDLKKVHPFISPLLQVMPWPEIGKLSDRDIEAMYAYLSAIPHADPLPR
jgi:cytochrome c553